MGSPALPFDYDLLSGGAEIPHYADFDLSSQTVTTSVNVNMANIVDRGNGWYLIKILGPILAQTQSSYVSRILSDTTRILDEINLDSNVFYLAPDDLLTNTSNSTVDLFNLGSLYNEDLNALLSLDMISDTGSADLMTATSIEFPADLL